MKKFICLIIILSGGIVNATELPKMSWSNQVKFLKVFPLNTATPIDIFNAYGAPKTKLDLTDNIAVWTYYSGLEEKGVSYTFHFQNGVVSDVVNKFSGLLGPKERKASLLQK